MKRPTIPLLLALCAVASADVLPSAGPPAAGGPQLPQGAIKRDPVALARRHPVIARQLAELRSDQTPAPGPARDESVVQAVLDGQCGFAGCSSSTLVVFTLRTRGANPATRSVLALVTCPPVGACQTSPAEVRPSLVPRGIPGAEPVLSPASPSGPQPGREPATR